MYLDASSFAYGGCTFRIDDRYDFFYQAFPFWSMAWIVIAKKLLAILHGLQSYQASLSDKVVKVFTCSKNTASISTKGSNSLRLHTIALEIFAYCGTHDILLDVEWIPCSFNSYAHSITRVIDYDWAVLCFGALVLKTWTLLVTVGVASITTWFLQFFLLHVL